MNKEDGTAALNFIRSLLSALGKPRLNEDAEWIWLVALGDLSLVELQSACIQFVRNGDDWPTPSKILDIVTRSRWPTPDEAWKMAPKGDWCVGGVVSAESQVALDACSKAMSSGDYATAHAVFLERYAKELKGKRGYPKLFVRYTPGYSEDERQTYLENLSPEVAALVEQPARGLLS